MELITLAYNYAAYWYEPCLICQLMDCMTYRLRRRQLKMRIRLDGTRIKTTRKILTKNNKVEPNIPP